MLPNGPNVFATVDLQLKLAKSGLKACGGCKIGLARSSLACLQVQVAKIVEGPCVFNMFALLQAWVARVLSGRSPTPNAVNEENKRLHTAATQGTRSEQVGN